MNDPLTRFLHSLRPGLFGLLMVAFVGLLCSCQTSSLRPDSQGDPGWISLFDGKTLGGWKDPQYGGHLGAEVRDGKMILAMGEQLTGIRWEGKVPVAPYEVCLEAMRMEGSDFFCGLTFPVGGSSCTFVVGGWGGCVVGISSIDDNDASENETTQYRTFEKGRWYQVRVRVTNQKIEAWLDSEKMVDVVLVGRKINMRRGEIESLQPFGLATWRTQAAFRNLRIQEFKAQSTGATK